MKIPRIKDYPREIHANGSLWEVRFCKKMPDSKNTDTTLGLCDPSSLVIFIKLGQGRSETLSTFVHELFHLLEFEYDIEIPHKLITKLEVPVRDLILENFFYE